MGRSRKSKRRLNSVFMMLLLSAVLLIMSSYAWFTANRVVTINGISAKVTVAEGLQISLDGQNWSNSITANPDVLSKLGTATSTDGSNSRSINEWIWPSELKPVSTDATLTSGLPTFKDGTVSTDGRKLSSIDAVTPNYAATPTVTEGVVTAKGEKLIVFDAYLRNTSGSTGTDDFQLAIGTGISLFTQAEGGVEGTGLENSSRVGVLLYGGNVSTAAQNQYDICNIAISGSKFAIWEPNYTTHISDTVAMDPRLSSTSDAFQTRAIARTSASTIDDVIDVNATNTDDLVAVKTTYTEGSSLDTDVNLLDASQETDTTLTLPRNAVSKVKIYIWLEGQDPDCNDYASAGGGLNYIIKFTKPNTQGGGN